MKMRMKMAMMTGIMTKKRTKLPKQYVLTGDEVQALVDFAREVIGLAVEDDDGKEPGYLLVAGQLDTDTIKRFDAIIRHHGFEELIQDGELDDDLRFFRGGKDNRRNVPTGVGPYLRSVKA
jgi:hypothetical protein